MTREPEEPALSFLTCHWLSMVGGGLATIAACMWLLIAPMLKCQTTTASVEVLRFLILPLTLAVGLILIPIGMWLSRRGVRRELKRVVSRAGALRRLVIFLAVTTIVNIAIM